MQDSIILPSLVTFISSSNLSLRFTLQSLLVSYIIGTFITLNSFLPNILRPCASMEGTMRLNKVILKDRIKFLIHTRIKKKYKDCVPPSFVVWNSKTYFLLPNNQGIVWYGTEYFRDLYTVRNSDITENIKGYLSWNSEHFPINGSLQESSVISTWIYQCLKLSVYYRA